MEAGWHVFWPLLDAAHAVDLVVLDGPKSYRLQVKTVERRILVRSLRTVGRNGTSIM
jgi:hypothetical protein